MLSETENLLHWLESSSWAVYIRQSLWLYPALEIVHIMGIAILVGAAFLFDLRLLGFSKNLSVDGLANHLLPWSRRGLWLIVPSGILLFITNAETLGKDPTFWLKMLLLVIAGLNALVFHKYVYPPNIHLQPEKQLPFSARFSAAISIIVWIAVVACGRLLAY